MDGFLKLEKTWPPRRLSLSSVPVVGSTTWDGLKLGRMSFLRMIRGKWRATVKKVDVAFKMTKMTFVTFKIF